MDSETFRHVLMVLKERYSISYPAHIKPGDPFATLIGAILSHRTKDEMTDKAFENLFKRYSTPEEIAMADKREVERLIRYVGFYRQKAGRIKKVAKIIVEKYGGSVPRDREELMKLPGVGPKTADIVLSLAFKEPEVAVDTHVETVAKRLGIAPEEADYEEVKESIEKLASLEDRLVINTLFVKFGKEICRKPKPRCHVCPFTNICKYYQQHISNK